MKLKFSRSSKIKSEIGHCHLASLTWFNVKVIPCKKNLLYLKVEKKIKWPCTAI